VDGAGSEETLDVESIQASDAIEREVFGDEFRDVVCRLTADFRWRDVRLCEFGTEEGPEEKKDCSLIVYAGKVG
jgi:hypothetical protein